MTQKTCTRTSSGRTTVMRVAVLPAQCQERRRALLQVSHKVAQLRAVLTSAVPGPTAGSTDGDTAMTVDGGLLPTPKPKDNRPVDPLVRYPTCVFFFCAPLTTAVIQAHDPLLASARPPNTQAALFVGHFNWWTLDSELLALCTSCGVDDVTRVCIVTDPLNGCSKG